MTNTILWGKLDVVNPHVRLDEVEVASYPSTVGRPEGIVTRGAKPRRESLLHKNLMTILSITLVACCWGGEDTLVRLLPDKTQVYVADGSCAVARYAAGELCKRLSQVFGSEVPVTNAFLDGFTPIVVGDNALSRAAGIDVDGLPKDATEWGQTTFAGGIS